MKTSYFQSWRVQIIFFSTLLMFSVISCKKFVQIPPPYTAVVAADVFSNNGTATAAVTSMYTQMFNNSESWNISQDQGLLADELTSFSTDPNQMQLYTNSMTALNNTGEWANAYNYIYQANAIIEGLENNGNITPAVAQQLTGEAKFVRAFWHFYLTNQYGDVPLVTSTLYTSNAAIARTSQALVYAQIVQDLTDAQAELNSNYVDGSDTTVTTERVRPTKAAAEAFLARAYLYTQKYDSAETYASKVISNSLYSLCLGFSPANSVFLKNSTEAIWQLSTPLPTSVNTIDAQYFILPGAPSTGDAQSAAISPQLLNSFEVGDLRRINWIDSTGTVPDYYYPYKYQAYNTGIPLTEYTMVFRLAEQYLIRAEAEANLADSTDAITDLNTIRFRAGLPAYNPLINGSLLTAILHERQVELFTEWGNRWFDLIRTGNVNSVMSMVTPIKSSGTVSWVSTDQLWPIPESEILVDPKLSQNSGY